MNRTDCVETSGETLFVTERVVVAPIVGVFRPLSSALICDRPVRKGQVLGTVEGPGSSTPVRSPFSGRLMGMLAWAGERVRSGQPVAWLTVV